MTANPAPDWRQHAACRGVDPNLFFPEHGNTADDAKAICQGCRVRLPCLELALTMQNDFYGVYGGCSVNERNTIRRRRKASA